MFSGSLKPKLLSPTSEVTLPDARFLLAGPGGVAAAIMWRRSPRRPDAGLLTVCLIVYLVWLFQFGVHRYVVGLEVLLGALLLPLCSRIPRADWRMAALGIACAVTLARLHLPTGGICPGGRIDRALPVWNWCCRPVRSCRALGHCFTKHTLKIRYNH